MHCISMLGFAITKVSYPFIWSF